MSYQKYEELVAPARPTSEPGRLIVGFVLILTLGAVLKVSLLLMMRSVAPSANDALYQGIVSGESPGATLVVLFSFLLTIVAIALVLPRLHKRGLLTLLGPLRELAADFKACLKWLLPLALLVLVLPSGTGGDLLPGLSGGLWLLLLPVSLLALLIQVSAEEILFRGYVQSQLAARFASPLVWILLPATLFGLGHFDPAAGDLNPWYISWALLFAVAAADLTARSGNLGPAIAFHFTNNLMAVLFVALPGNLSGLALYLYPFSSEELPGMTSFLVLDMAWIAVSWLACRVAVRR